MKKLLILSVALLATISCEVNSNVTDVEVTIETLQGSSFTLSQFGAYKFPATDNWVIEDQQATTDDFAGLSAAIEYISNIEPDRQIAIEFSQLEAIPAYAIFGVALSNSKSNFTALNSVAAPYATSIGTNAFEFCSSLTAIEVPMVQSVGGYALRGCSSLTSIDLAAATEINYAAFSDCNSLKSINIPLVETISEQAFRLCSSLQSVSLPSLVALGSGAFTYCESLASVDAPQLLTIDDYAFCECSSLDDISTPVVETIGNYAFIACSAFESYTIPESVTSLGDGVFNDCTALTTIVPQSELFVFADGVLYNADQSEVIGALLAVVSGDLVLGDSVTSMRDRAFYNCADITSVTLPSVTKVSDYAFANCSNILYVDLPVATQIGNYAFSKCDQMLTANAPEVRILDSYSFDDCEDLIELYFATNSGVKFESIDPHTFYGVTISNIVLTVSISNAEYVSYSDTLTVGDFEGEFDSVVMLANQI